jgi:hypothetical protein
MVLSKLLLKLLRITTVGRCNNIFQYLIMFHE